MNAPPRVPVNSEIELLVAELADEFQSRLERGESPNPSDYAARLPAAGDLIVQVLRTLQLAGSCIPANRVGPPADLHNAVEGTLGDYRIIRELGRGGMGVVYEAEQLSLGRRVALKVLPFSAVSDTRLLQRFQNEARAAAALDHPHVVKIFGVGEVGGVHFLALQLINGQPVSQFIHLRHRTEKRDACSPPIIVRPDDPTVTNAGEDSLPNVQLPRNVETWISGDPAYFRQVAAWGIQAAEALEHAHSMGVVHRDVKPGNLLLDSRGELWVTDFGLAKLAASDAGLTGTGDVLGTLRYMSPEQALSKHDLVDHHSDIYSLGATLYELLIGVPAVDGRDKAEILRRVASEEPTRLRKVDRSIPVDLETVILTCLNKDPGERYSSADALAKDLKRWLAGEPILARTMGRVARTIRWVRRNPRVTVVGILLFVMTVGLAGTSALFWRQRQRAEQANEAEANERQRAERLYRQAESAYEQESHHRRRARQAVDTMYTDVAEKLLPTEPGMGAARRDLLLKALAFYEEEATGLRDDPEAQIGAAWANKRAARILWMLGDNARAMKLYDRAVGLVEELLVREPVNRDWRAARALFYFERSFVFVGMAQTSPAMTDRRLALSLYEQLAKEYPAEWAYRDAEAHVSGSLGLLEIDPVECERLYRQALRLTDRLKHDFPTGSHNEFEVALISMRLGRILARKPGMEVEGEALLSAATEILRKVNNSKQVYPENLYHLGCSLVYQGEAMDRRASGDARAVEKFEEARTIFRRLDRDHAGHTFPGHSVLGESYYHRGDINEAVKCYEESIRQRPHDLDAHHGLWMSWIKKNQFVRAAEVARKAATLNADDHRVLHMMGVALSTEGDLVEGMKLLQKAIQLRPDHSLLHSHLGTNLWMQGHRHQALAAYREAFSLNPHNAQNFLSLGDCQHEMGDLSGAVRTFREAIKTNPHSPSGHMRLGLLLLEQGTFEESLTVLRRCHELGSGQKNWSYPSMEWVRTAESMVRIERKLPSVLSGEASPADLAEQLEMASMCLKFKNRPAAAARLYGDAFSRDSSLKRRLESHQYLAARAAALAGTGRGEDAQKLPETERARLRQAAYQGLKAELKIWRAILALPGTRFAVNAIVGRWRSEPSLAGVRDPNLLAQLPAMELQSWNQFWSEVSALGSAADQATPAQNLGPPPRLVPNR